VVVEKNVVAVGPQPGWLRMKGQTLPRAGAQRRTHRARQDLAPHSGLSQTVGSSAPILGKHCGDKCGCRD
jgi:hypothetical protein